ncbi:TonB-dependent receptor [Flavisphingomonas formosensis]|uniref:TonB-dependent receptor n=1 Tax=Flavisphingomonas formosensis TaxID=861534 RepID=UPI0012FB6CE8|nr:TonB-dependent receptor [Sphingomonas formosensis]
MKSRPSLYLGVASLLALVAAAEAAQAQTAPGTPQKTDTSPDDIVVTGYRASLRDALKAKRAATVVTETISSKDIGVLPDVTIADELARLPGITATRDRGNASQAVVRGLGPRLVLGLVNGREVASSEPDRNVRWEIYPSEIVSGVTVYKSQSADLIAGGVAATIDIRTLHPLDYTGPALTVRGGALYNDGGKDIPHYGGWGTRESGQYVAKLTDTLAVAVGGSYQKQKNGFASFQGWGYNTVDTGSPPTLDGKPINAPWGAQTEVKALTETRWSTTGALEWKPGGDWDVNADFLYSDVKINERQYQQWYGRSNGWGDWGGTIGGPGDIYQPGNYTIVGNDIVAGTLNNYSSVTNVLGHYTEDKNLIATGLNAKYSGDDWTVKFDGSYSLARRDNIWRAVASEVYPASTSFSTGAGSVPTVSTSIDPADPSIQSVRSYYAGLVDGPQRLRDSLAAGQADVYHTLHDGFFTGFGAGMRYSNRVKSFKAFTSAVTTNTGGDVSIPSSMLGEFNVGGFNVPNLMYGNYEQIAGLALNIAAPIEDLSKYWRVREDDFEGYLLADFGGNGFTGNVGVRFVDVSTHSNAFQGTTSWDPILQANVTSYAPVSANNHYFRALPSLNLNFDLSDKLKLRAGIARVMSRPPLDELRASRSLSYYPPTNTGSAGNPQLKPFMASQADLSLEWYFHKDALFALAGYYKKVGTNIGYTQAAADIDGASYTITRPANGKGGNIAGLEATFQTPFYFIPGLDHFGIYSNVALVHSNIKELAPSSNPFPAVGLAKFTGELDLYYSDHGIDARVALKHHTPFTVIYGWDSSQLTRLEAETTLGASLSYTINRNFSVRVQANNLTNQVARFYWNNDPQQLARYERYGRSYLMDVTFKY